MAVEIVDLTAKVVFVVFYFVIKTIGHFFAVRNRIESERLTQRGTKGFSNNHWFVFSLDIFLPSTVVVNSCCSLRRPRFWLEKKLHVKKTNFSFVLTLMALL